VVARRGEARDMSDRITSSARDAVTKRDLLRIVRSAIARGDLPAEAEQEAVEGLGTFVKQFALTRRDLIKATAATAGLTLVAVDAFSRSAEARSILAATPSLTASVLRRDDMLALRFDFYNLVRNQQGNLVRQNATQPAYVVVSPGYGADHAPQNVAEQAFLEKDDSGTPAEAVAAPGDVKGLLAGRTRLAFRVPPGITSIPLTLSSLLNFAQFEPSVVPVALPPNPDPSLKPTIREPNETETWIETPWHMVLSPHVNSAWAHATSPVVRNGRAELWHTRLAVRGESNTPDEKNADLRTVRAVWTPGFDRNNRPPQPPPDPAFEPPFRMSLNSSDRWKIVEMSSDYDLPNDPLDASKGKYVPKAIKAERLMLSALGAWQNTLGSFVEPPKTFNLGEWRHIATMGRDQYVRVVYLGWYLPFKFPAALIKVSERKMYPPNGSDRGAYLRQRFFLFGRVPFVTYPDAPPQTHEGREMPYKSVELKTIITPTIEPPSAPTYAFTDPVDNHSYGDHAFFPVVHGKLLQFSVVGTDRDKQRSELTMPLAFVSYTDKTANFFDDDIDHVVEAYAAGNFPSGVTALMTDPRVTSLGGQKVAMAKSTKPGDTTVEAKTMAFSAVNVDPTQDHLLAPGEAPFFPTWTEVEARLNGVEQVRGDALSNPAKLVPHNAFVTGGFNAANPGQVYARLKDPVPTLGFTDKNNLDRAGGLANLDMAIGGVSRTLGPVGGKVDDTLMNFDPKKFFSGAKILGGINLGDIIVGVDLFADLNKIPKLTTRTIYPDDKTDAPPKAIETKLSFVPQLQTDLAGIFDPTGASMTIDATYLTPIEPPGEPTYDIVGDLRHFTVHLLGTAFPLIALSFNQLKFTTKNGKKPNVDVDINEVKFEGVLQFVNTLKDYLKIGGVGPNIDIQPTYVTAGFGIPIPTVGVGVLTIQNIAFSAGMTIPFNAKPARARFAFSSREDPFLVTVIGLGGGGFFAIAVGLDGMELFEMSIEVGASIALDVGVASGEVHALAGIYYRLERKKAEGTTPEHDEVELDGYIRLGGSLSVLGIASVSVEFYLGLKYDPNELWGQAKLTVEIEVAMFSKSFELKVERHIAGSDTSSSALMPGIAALGGTGSRMASLAGKTNKTFDFTDLLSQDEWNEYVAAFATVS
jgi:hypothetical protein